MDDDDVRIPGATDGTKMTSPGVRINGTAVVVKQEPSSGTGGGGGSNSKSPTPNGSKEDSISPSLSSDDVKHSPSDSASTPDTGSALPKLNRKSLTMQPQKGSPTTASSATARLLFDHLPDATEEATNHFQIITDCLYGSKHMGSSDHDAFECDCAEEWRDGQNLACGEDSDCINRATKMECVEGDCNCGEGCQNQRFQRKEYARVSVIKTEKKGFGLRADADLHPNDFIFEYIGEVINEPTFRRRMLQYDEEGIKHFYFMSLTKSEFVDATRKGNLGRFCNHSCNPNCYVDKWVVGEKLRMGIFAGRHIRSGEELVFDYNVDRYGADPQPCYCGEPNCTGFIGGKTQTERATKLSQATIEALGIEDPDSWDTTVSKKQRRKKPSEDDEEYVSSLQQTGLAEDGVTKVMAALMQCKEKWIAVKLLSRIQAARGDERVLNRVVRMHGYQILCSILTTFHDDNNVILQVLDILYKFPRLTKNKISDSNIESVIESLTSSEHEDVAAESKRLLDEWGKLETAYRIPRKKFDPNAPPTASFEDRRGRDTANNDSDDTSSAARQRAPLSPLHGMVIPKGPRSNVPQRNSNFFNNTPRNQRRQKNNQIGVLPPGWFTANDPNGNVYYYTKSGATTWKRPTQPADKASIPSKVLSKAQQEKDAVQEIINSLTKEAPRPSASQTPQTSETPVPEANRKDKWRSLPIEKQKKIYENTLFPHIKSVTDRFRHRLPKEEIKKFGKEISKKLVASDYKNNRVEDPHKITPRQEKKVRAYVKDFFERATQKYQQYEKKKAEREARHAAARDRKEAGAAAAVQEDAEIREPADGNGQLEKDDTELAALDDMAISDDEEDEGREAQDGVEQAVFSPDPSDRKRKRADTDHGVVPSPSLTPSETPSMKRLKDEDAAAADGSLTPSTPPPPPPPPPAEDETFAQQKEEDMQQKAAQRQRDEDEEALRRENEEALRDFEEQKQQQQKQQQGHSTDINGIIGHKTAGVLVPLENGLSAMVTVNGGKKAQQQQQQGQ